MMALIITSPMNPMRETNHGTAYRAMSVTTRTYGEGLAQHL